MTDCVKSIPHKVKLVFTVVFALFFFHSKAQPRYNDGILDTLEKIAASNNQSAHFARLYHNAIEKTNEYARDQSGNVQQFIFGFETAFSQRFIKANGHFVNHEPQDFSWQYYYSDTAMSELQYQFIGMNAHINGDMWQALKEKYGYDTLKKYRKPLIRFQRALNVFFDSIYSTTATYKKIGRLHQYTLGLDKVVGRKMVLNWRKRQVKLAMLFYSKPRKCARKWRQLQKNMLRWDRRSTHWMKA